MRDSFYTGRHAKYDRVPALSWGIVQNQAGGATEVPWNPGTTYCTLKPCTDQSGQTPTGAPDVQVLIASPNVSFFGALVNDVLAYIAQPMNEKVTINGAQVPLAGILLTPPIPTTTEQFAEALVNQSGTANKPNYEADYPTVHP